MRFAYMKNTANDRNVSQYLNSACWGHYFDEHNLAFNETYLDLDLVTGPHIRFPRMECK